MQRHNSSSSAVQKAATTCRRNCHFASSWFCAVQFSSFLTSGRSWWQVSGRPFSGAFWSSSLSPGLEHLKLELCYLICSSGQKNSGDCKHMSLSIGRPRWYIIWTKQLGFIPLFLKATPGRKVIFPSACGEFFFFILSNWICENVKQNGVIMLDLQNKMAQMAFFCFSLPFPLFSHHYFKSKFHKILNAILLKLFV